LAAWVTTSATSTDEFMASDCSVGTAKSGDPKKMTRTTVPLSSPRRVRPGTYACLESRS
jgi:hypothetical protein